MHKYGKDAQNAQTSPDEMGFFFSKSDHSFKGYHLGLDPTVQSINRFSRVPTLLVIIS